VDDRVAGKHLVNRFRAPPAPDFVKPTTNERFVFGGHWKLQGSL
jgi:hypothetical protein